MLRRRRARSLRGRALRPARLRGVEADDAGRAAGEGDRIAVDHTARGEGHGLGRGGNGQQPSEKANAQFRRSLYFVRALRSGDTVTAADVRSVRPGYGLAPKHLDAVIGRRTTQDIAAHTPVGWHLLN